MANHDHIWYYVCQIAS
ncbi:hypothetical protein F383_35911 [Gossypium arboreum]|uniref:Uncharacterized protein n=1 Tax=Gossypium arboreum TaxID=29729 RepID=A0A0B0PVG3_GOSAR|nr:hypothetical protein F383_35911 [Gossypium arboreum]